MRSIISTVGKSLQSNAERELETEEPDFQGLANYLRHTEDKEASAETNSLSKLKQESDKLIFLHSATDEGRKCAQSLLSYYENKGYQTEEVEVEDLNYKESKFKMRGLRFLVERLTELIEKEREAGRKVLINATGGFKAEIAYATMIGLLLKVPVYYIHEVFNDIIEMPPSPINWDYSFIAEFEDFFTWLNADLRKTEEVENRLSEIENKLKSRHFSMEKSIQDIRLLLAEEEGFTLLSPTGQTYFKSYKNYMQTAEKLSLYISETAKKQLENMEPSIKQEFKDIFKKLTVREVWASPAARKQGDCLVYPQGHINERVFFFDDMENNELYICELSRHSDDSYEKLLEDGVWSEDYQNFEKLSPKTIWG